MLCASCESIIEPLAPIIHNEPYRRDESDDNPRHRRRDEYDDQPRPRRRYDYDDDPRRRYDDDDPRPRRRPQKKGSLLWLWLLLGLGGMLGIAAAAGVIYFVVQKAANPPWKSFTPPDGRFTADFPGGNPVQQIHQIPDDNGGPPTPMTMHLVETSFGEVAYGVGHFDLNEGEHELSKTEIDLILNRSLDAYKNNTANGRTLREIRRTDITIQGHPAKEIVGDHSSPSVPRGRVVMRITIIGKRMYTLIVVG
jgi:hypothetical protein